jgi:hypothetical protein
VVIFIHFCEMFIYVQPSVSLFRLFHVMWLSGRGSDLIDAYYIQHWAKGPIVYITLISPDKWDH